MLAKPWLPYPASKRGIERKKEARGAITECFLDSDENFLKNEWRNCVEKELARLGRFPDLVSHFVCRVLTVSVI
jgi:hypothetical protein